MPDPLLSLRGISKAFPGVDALRAVDLDLYPGEVLALLGLGVLGMVVGHFSRPLSVGLSVVGVARTLHSNVLGRGREVQFPADTNLQLQLAPGPMDHR